MADDKNKPGDEQSSDPSSVPEVEAEIVGEDEPLGEAAGFDDGEEIKAETDAPGPLSPTLTPGVILFVVFVVVALLAFFFWRFQSGGKDAEQTPPPAVESQEGDAGEAARDAIGRIGADEPGEEPAAPDAASEPPITATQSSPDPSKIENDAAAAIKETLPEPGIETDAPEADGMSLPPAPVEDDKIGGRTLGEELKDSLQALEPPQDAPQDAPMSFEIEEAGAVPAEEGEPAIASEGVSEAPPEPLQQEPVISEPMIEEAALSPDAKETPADDSLKITNDIAALKEMVRSETANLAAALEEERARSAALEDEIRALRQDFAAALAARDEQTAAQLSSMQSDLEKIQNTGVPARVAAGAVALSALKSAVDEGRPFADDLAVLAGIAPDAPSIAALRPYAETGVPTLTALKESFGAAAREGLVAAGQEKASGPWGALAARAQSLVSVRPATPQTGDAPAEIISRAEYAAGKGDISAALSELEALPEPVRAAMSGWIKNAQARASADAAIDRLSERFLEAARQ